MAVKTERESFPMTADYLIVLFADVAIVESPIRMFTLPYFSLSSGQTVFSLAECVPGVFFTLFPCFLCQSTSPEPLDLWHIPTRNLQKRLPERSFQ